MGTRKWLARTKQELIIEVWEDLDCESVGASELEVIQRELCETFGEGAVESPAAIARVVADEGAVLRHPEVLDCDTAWRETTLTQIDSLTEMDPSHLREAHLVLLEINSRRKDYLRDGAEAELLLLRKLVLEQKQYVQLLSSSRIVDSDERETAAEIAQWLTVWLQDPELFEHWIGLRLQAPEFLKRFGRHFE